MKNIIFIVLILLTSNVYIFANTLDKQYKEALSYYNNKDFKSSYEIFSKLYLSHLSDEKLNFYLGRSAYETGYYEVALAAFERVDELDPGNLRNRLEMARTYFMLKMYEESEIAFKDVLENPSIPDNVRRNIELYLSKVTKVQQKSFTYANIDLDWIYDSNVNYSASDDFNYGIVSVISDEESDSGIQIYGDIVNIYDIGEKNGFAIKNRLITYMKEYDTKDNYDVTYIAYTPSIIYKYTKHTFELAIGIDNTQIAHKSYLNSSYIVPRYEYAHTTTLKSISYLKYQRKRFQLNSDLDVKHYELAYSLQKILSPRSYVQLGLTGIIEEKEQGNRLDIDYDEYKVALAYANQFTPRLGAEFYAEYRNRTYDDFHTVFNNTREDNSGTTGLTLNAKIIETLNFHIKGMYTKVDSNQEAFKYKKYTLAIGLNKTF